LKKQEHKITQLSKNSNEITDEDQNGENNMMKNGDEAGSDKEDNEDDFDDLKSEEDEIFEKEYEATSMLARKELLLVDGTINEKEDLLRSIT